ncbi:MAG: hypothetical protein QOJ00_376, partial [Actinomycetota bacterium]
ANSVVMVEVGPAAAAPSVATAPVAPTPVGRKLPATGGSAPTVALLALAAAVAVSAVRRARAPMQY